MFVCIIYMYACVYIYIYMHTYIYIYTRTYMPDSRTSIDATACAYLPSQDTRARKDNLPPLILTPLIKTPWGEYICYYQFRKRKKPCVYLPSQDTRARKDTCGLASQR